MTIQMDGVWRERVSVLPICFFVIQMDCKQKKSISQKMDGESAFTGQSAVMNRFEYP